MCPNLIFSLFTVPEGNSSIFSNTGFHRSILLGERFSLNFTVFPSLSRITTSIGNLRKNVCSPNRVFKNNALGFLKKTIPAVFSKRLLAKKIFMSRDLFSLSFVSTSLLYLTRCGYKKEV